MVNSAPMPLCDVFAGHVSLKSVVYLLIEINDGGL